MNMTTELKYTLSVALLVILLIAIYGVRVVLKGRARFDRIDRQGGSRLLSVQTMEIGYWILDPVARLLAFLRVTPNMVSWTSLACGFIAGLCLALGHFGFGAISATISGVLDSVDGMVARISGLASDAGELLDAAIDRYVEFFFLSGLIIYYRDIPAFQVLALLALLGSFLVSYSTTKAEALQIDPPKGSMRRPERAVYLTLGASLSALSIPWFETRGTFANPVGYPMVVALGVVAILANLSSIERFRFITSALRRRDQNVTGSGARESQKVVIEQPGGSPQGHAANIRL